jgi:hypothetical protein
VREKMEEENEKNRPHSNIAEQRATIGVNIQTEKLNPHQKQIRKTQIEPSSGSKRNLHGLFRCATSISEEFCQPFFGCLAGEVEVEVLQSPDERRLIETVRERI